MKYTELEQKVIEWGAEKGILDNSTPLRQLSKTQEELNETREALEKLAQIDNAIQDNQFLFPIEEKEYREKVYQEVKDGIGDMLVTIILLAKLCDTDTNETLQMAYDIISKRTGKMVNGLFVKDQ